MRLLVHTAVFVALAPGSLVVAVPALIVWRTGARVGGLAALGAAIPLLAVGLAVFLWTVADFIRRGRGTPDPNRPPTALVTRGLSA